MDVFDHAPRCSLTLATSNCNVQFIYLMGRDSLVPRLPDLFDVSVEKIREPGNEARGEMHFQSQDTISKPIGLIILLT